MSNFLQKSIAQIFNLRRGIKVFIVLLLVTTLGLQILQSASASPFNETKLIFHPINKNMSDIRLDLDGKLQDTYFYSLDGIKLNAWYIKAKPGKPTIIYCHGQGENISLWQSVAQEVTDKGYGIFMLDYRGHGRSEGTPSETGLYLDLESAVKYLKDFEKISQDNIILWGRSLGGAVVADVASRDKFKGVILESTFTNIREAAIHLTSTGILEGKKGFWGGMATKFVKYLPLTQTFETDHKIQKITSPLLIGASQNDDTIPCEMSRELAAINSKAELFVCEKGSHHSSEWFVGRALGFLASLDKESDAKK